MKLPAPETVHTQPDLIGVGDPAFPHVPNADWQPVPQYALVVPVKDQSPCYGNGHFSTHHNNRSMNSMVLRRDRLGYRYTPCCFHWRCFHRYCLVSRSASLQGFDRGGLVRMLQEGGASEYQSTASWKDRCAGFGIPNSHRPFISVYMYIPWNECRASFDETCAANALPQQRYYLKQSSLTVHSPVIRCREVQRA